MNRLRHGQLFALALAACTISVRAGEPERFQLDNGLRVVLESVPGGSKVALVTLFDIGESHNPSGRSGLAHVTEHVYVTARAGARPARSAEELFRAYPDGSNAQTGADYTVIAWVFPAAKLAAEIEEAAARMGRLEVTQADLERELPRMNRELENMYRAFPHLAGMNSVRQAVDPMPGGARRGGNMAELEKITPEEVGEFHRKYYKPRNARLVVAGGFDLAEAKKLIQTRFGALPPGEPVPAPRNAGKAVANLLSTLEITRPSFGKFPSCLATIGFRAPDPRSDLYPPFLILVAGLLDATAAETQEVLRMNREGTMAAMPVHYMLLDDPRTIFFSKNVFESKVNKEAMTRLEDRVEKMLENAMQNPDPEKLSSLFGVFLGLVDFPAFAVATNPYPVAFSLGRRDQLGIDPVALKKKLESVDEKALDRCVREVFAWQKSASIVVRVKDK